MSREHDDEDVEAKTDHLKLVDGILVDPNKEANEEDDSSSSSDEEEEVEEDREVHDCAWRNAAGSSYEGPGRDARCACSSYGGSTKSEEELRRAVGEPGPGGLEWSVRVLPNNDDDDDGIVVKARRKPPFPIRFADFASSVVRVGTPRVKRLAEEEYEDLWDPNARSLVAGSNDDEKEKEEGARWIFSGVLNGWPGLTTLEVVKVQYRSITGAKKTKTKSMPRFRRARRGGGGGGGGKWKHLWRVSEEGEYGTEPADVVSDLWKKEDATAMEVRATLRGPKWTSQGWSERSPGFVYWVRRDDGPTSPLTVTYGTDLLRKFPRGGGGGDGDCDDPLCARVHMISHRYAQSVGKKESARDRLTYHSFVLIEWEHRRRRDDDDDDDDRRCCTVAEIAWLNGLSGYAGKANWYDDRDAKPFSELYGALPPETVMPWRTTMSEIRLHDVPYRDADDFEERFLREHEGPGGRFLDVRRTFSHEVRLTHRSRSDLCVYLLNYIRRDQTYDQIRRNCQTFAADLCGFLAGKKNVKPFHFVNQVEYVNRNHFFLYESDKYKNRRK